MKKAVEIKELSNQDLNETVGGLCVIIPLLCGTNSPLCGCMCGGWNTINPQPEPPFQYGGINTGAMNG